LHYIYRSECLQQRTLSCLTDHDQSGHAKTANELALFIRADVARAHTPAALPPTQPSLPLPRQVSRDRSFLDHRARWLDSSPGSSRARSHGCRCTGNKRRILSRVMAAPKRVRHDHPPLGCQPFQLQQLQKKGQFARAAQRGQSARRCGVSVPDGIIVWLARSLRQIGHRAGSSGGGEATAVGSTSSTGGGGGINFSARWQRQAACHQSYGEL
jgi:hypothetical protein